MATSTGFKEWLARSEQQNEAWGMQTLGKIGSAIGSGFMGLVRWLAKKFPRTAALLQGIAKVPGFLLSPFIRAIKCMINGPGGDAKKHIEEVQQKAQEELGDFAKMNPDQIMEEIKQMESEAKDLNTEEDKEKFKKKHGRLLKFIIVIGNLTHIIPMGKSVGSGAGMIGEGASKLKEGDWSGVLKMAAGATLILHTLTIGGIISGLLPKILILIEELGVHMNHIGMTLGMATLIAWGSLILAKGLMKCFGEKKHIGSALVGLVIVVMEPSHAHAIDKAHKAVEAGGEAQTTPAPENKVGGVPHAVATSPVVSASGTHPVQTANQNTGGEKKEWLNWRFHDNPYLNGIIRHEDSNLRRELRSHHRRSRLAG